MKSLASRPRQNRALIVAGAGGHGRVCVDVARRCGWQVAGFVDRCHPCGTEVAGAPILANDETALFADWPADTILFVALGDNARRLAIVREATRLRIDVAILVDPAAIVSPSASLAPGVVVMPGAVVNAEAHVGTAAIVNTSAIVEHGVNLGEGAHVAPGACLTGDAVVGA
jgi:UDP-perosamine 4-acetyltransferase